ncbi:hypothetical protein FB565_000510 [Actinoplanes lutulentus]|uniref:Uncharacterized protein n=1 Tax=Actinoplanes lutulentus TaxID=1287878 RepID=A0A327ZLX0_9ACTN|nr:hypothetical protein [Actinoplanes lutulentus]RAK43116.1 hypothetical protein B0I29_101246 [Actinoplanes lutulentus]
MTYGSRCPAYSAASRPAAILNSPAQRSFGFRHGAEPNARRGPDRGGGHITSPRSRRGASRTRAWPDAGAGRVAAWIRSHITSPCARVYALTAMKSHKPHPCDFIHASPSIRALPATSTRAHRVPPTCFHDADIDQLALRGEMAKVELSTFAISVAGAPGQGAFGRNSGSCQTVRGPRFPPAVAGLSIGGTRPDERSRWVSVRPGWRLRRPNLGGLGGAGCRTPTGLQDPALSAFGGGSA